MTDTAQLIYWCVLHESNAYSLRYKCLWAAAQEERNSPSETFGPCQFETRILLDAEKVRHARN